MKAEKTDEILVFPTHCQEMGYCLKGARIWFAQAGLDFRDFVKNGIDAKTLEAFDDEYVQKLARHAREQA